MSSRFNSFTESRAHDRLASRFGGFGDGGGVFPDPGDCIVAVSPPFIYDWFTGEELLVNPPNPDWRIYSFDVDMVRVNYVEVGRTQEEEEAGFRRMGGFYGGKGVYWAMGQRTGPIDNGRHNVWDIGYELNQYGSVVQRYEMTAHRLIVYPDYQGPLATGGMPGGSGNIGNKAGLCWGSLARRVDRRAQFSYGLRRFAVPHMEWEDAVDIDTPDDLPLGVFRSSDGSLTVSTLDGEAGYALAPWDVGYRVPFFAIRFVSTSTISDNALLHRYLTMSFLTEMNISLFTLNQKNRQRTRAGSSVERRQELCILSVLLAKRGCGSISAVPYRHCSRVCGLGPKIF